MSVVKKTSYSKYYKNITNELFYYKILNYFNTIVKIKLQAFMIANKMQK